MNQKTLKELADEYAANVAVLDSQIDRCRLAIVDARRRHKNILVSRLMRNLSVLYAQREEQAEIQRHLDGYYETKERAAV